MMCSEGKRRYDTVEAIKKKLRTQGAWRKKQARITQQKACRDAGISEHQFRTWRKIINESGDSSLSDIYSALEDKRHAPNRLTREQEELVYKVASETPGMSHRGIAEEAEGLLGRKLHHSTIGRILKIYGS